MAHLEDGGSVLVPLLALGPFPGAQQGQAHLPVLVQVRVEPDRPVPSCPEMNLKFFDVDIVIVLFRCLRKTEEKTNIFNVQVIHFNCDLFS